MKRLILVLVLLFAVSPVWALFCQYCGKPVADDARFCAHCGKPQTAPSALEARPAPQPAQPPQKLPEAAPATVVSPAKTEVVAAPTDRLLLSPYEPINRYETLLMSATLDRADAGVNACRAEISRSLQRIGPETRSFSPNQQRLHALHLKKYDLLDRYYEAWHRSVKGTGQTEAAAEKEKLLFVIARHNEMIVALKDGGNDTAVLGRVDAMQKDLDVATREHQVTDPFLRVEGIRLNKGARFWVMDVSTDRARIGVLSECGAPRVVTAWVSFSELHRRTTWRCPAELCAQVFTPTEKVVVVERHVWWPGWPFPRHSHGCRCDRCHPSRHHGHSDRHHRGRRW